ncbi:MAG: Uma2 family endonuclease [Drouetiella hepatica Uher 2000/2452]|uniref:Uma2 family endonuclease n=1 Tax=Drouetiella hepatica Uher 2000/2452 TaxID=904376 RepID=A0A951UND9_9CYAN|nr:Uma2 family endonuclease [Drouetiella hepatica Uher 2000/2452]
MFCTIEVADSTLLGDRQQKALIYAKAGIADYWILNVNAKQVYVFREPTPEGYQQEYDRPCKHAACSSCVSQHHHSTQSTFSAKCFITKRSPLEVPSVEVGISSSEVKVPSSEAGGWRSPLKFRALRSAFQVLKSKFRVLRSEDDDRISKFRALRLAFQVPKSMFQVLRLEDGDRISNFRALRSAFRVLRSMFRVLRSENGDCRCFR